MNVTRYNTDTWDHSRFVRSYLGTDLRPPELEILTTYAEQFAGRVLELGCGSGRVTGHLAPASIRLEAIDISERMLQEARKRHPQVTFHRMNMTDLSRFDDDAFDAIIATCNVVDALDDPERRAMLREALRVLAPDGVLVFSSHNRAHIPLLKQPWQLPTHSLLAFGNSLVRLPLRLRNRRRLRSFVVRAPNYDILNDAAHDWRLLQYYISPEDERRQLGECGLELLECLGQDGATIREGDSAVEQTELHYVARPA